MRKALALGVALAVGAASSHAAAETFPPGSIIIPMDTTHQDSGMFRAYGLVYELLRKDVPINWVIRKGKAHLGTDFTVVSKDFKTQATLPSHGYRGGPWVIHPLYAAQATPIIQAWQTANPAVRVHVATTSFNGDVSKLLVVAPTIAMFADGNQKIARKYMQAAWIPDSSLDYAWPDSSPDMLDPTEMKGPTNTNHADGQLFDADGDPKYCQFMSMHWGVNDAQANPEVVAEVREFLKHGTHFFAECQAVNAYENGPFGKFLTPNGFLIGTKPGASVDFYNSDVPFAQLDGPFESVGGSEPSYTLPGTDKYKAGDVVMITQKGTPEGVNDVWMTGYVDGACPPWQEECGSLGKVSYLGGHEYDTKVPISTNPSSQGARLFLNSLFDSACATATGQPVISLVKSGPGSTTASAVTYGITYSNAGPTVALKVVLTDPIPAGSSFVSATNGGSFAAGVVTWNLGNLGIGESGSVNFTVSLPAHATYSNTAKLDYFVGLNKFTIPSNTVQTLYDKDTDGDGVLDGVDICPTHFNPAQNLQTDVLSCGSCGKVCTVANGTPACAAGTCKIASCMGTHADCDGLYSTGCEYAVTGFGGDPANCGSCGNACSYANANGLCAGGGCSMGGCNSGFANCNGLAADGCEYAVTGFGTDKNNCGSCGFKCSVGFVCQGGGCVLDTCPAGKSDCNGTASDGCEYDNAGFSTDVANCGGCGLVCAPANASGVCIAGNCGIGTCNSGFADCNQQASDGCEYGTAGFGTDKKNCGGCGLECAPANATGECAAGVCGINVCNAGFSDCNKALADGCEYANVGFGSDAQNCGGCGIKCAPANASGACVGGACTVVACNSGFVDLDGKPANGCEYACTSVGTTDSTCDGKDDDCDGKFDEDYVPTTCGVGACESQSTCVNGVSACTPGQPSAEGPWPATTCSDGADNDCDGLEDSFDPECTVPDGGVADSGSDGAAGAAGAGGASDGGGLGGGGGVAGAGGTGTGGASGSGGGAGAGGSAGAGGAGTGGAAGSGGSNSGGSATGGASTGGTGTGGGNVDAGSGAKPGKGTDSGDEGGCACRTPHSPASGGRGGWLLAAMGVVIAMTRRRSPSRPARTAATSASHLQR